ncbi:methyl-accepting chemotaxis protein [Roseateles saccharophilus]|uniref:Methyl-accepting chemotaxis protein n=2 Tax=Roseateles saccharophilus TaxID=304 RepID=A0A4R3UPS4_ROSSA|nr:methyl-accepting chemotaxis protein [Roseateles saccharophilus]MDG0833488.1 methyl-accepting chemotaxis protein [Roseateles saccharophilus]TCU92513.1 methyl-accepting chemotaxis protein [Roseateles saccharophilus]
MGFLTDLRIGQRLGMAFAISIGFCVLLAGYARVQLWQINDQLTVMVNDRIVKVEQLMAIKNNANLTARAVRNIMLLNDENAMKQEMSTIAANRKSTVELYEKLQQTIVDGEGAKLMAAAKEARAGYTSSMQRALDLAQQQQKDAARDALLGEVRTSQRHYFATLDALVDFQRGLMRESARAADASVAFASVAVLVAAGAAVMIGAAMALLITRSVVAPIREAVAAAETVASGDLRLRLATTRKDEAGQLLGALQRMNDGLVGIVGTVRGNADSVATASGQIAQGNAELSQRTEEQASNLQQTAASMEELSATVNHNTDTASQAAQLADSAARMAGNGGQVMSQVIETMDQITTSSKKIADIIGTIDGIAFQTNILALNAAVEAARAGEQGRGFAVVAGEVRTLAQRSAEASREIKTLIGSSVERVEAGNALVGEAGRTIGEVVDQVRRVADLISEISTASSEQSKGIAQVGEAVTQLDQVTQQNAALVEESAAAAESLRIQARQLAEKVATFKLDVPTERPRGGANPPASAALKPKLAKAELAVKPTLKKAARPAFAGVVVAEADKGEWTSF